MAKTLIRDNAEEALMETIEVCRKLNVPLRAIHFRFSSLPRTNPGDLDRILQTIEESKEDTESISYVCADSDIFVVSRTATYKRLLRILGCLPKDIVPAPSPELAHLFEMNVDGLMLGALCQEKIREKRRQELAAQREREAREAAEKQARAQHIDTHLETAATLIKTLPARRRENRKMTVLVIEDDPFSQRLVAGALREHYEVLLASDGREGLQTYLRTAPDVLFLDIDLPDITGHELRERLFNIDPQTYIIMLSGNGNKENIIRAVEGGAKGFVGKPFTREKLVQYIEKCPSIQDKKSKKELRNA